MSSVNEDGPDRAGLHFGKIFWRMLLFREAEFAEGVSSRIWTPSSRALSGLPPASTPARIALADPSPHNSDSTGKNPFDFVIHENRLPLVPVA